MEPFTRLLRVNGNPVLIREPLLTRKAQLQTDIPLLERLYSRLPDPKSVPPFPLRGVGVPLAQREWSIRRLCLLAFRDGELIATGAVYAHGASAELALWADPERAEIEVRQKLAEALLECARVGDAHGNPFWRLTTHNRDIAQTLGCRPVRGDLYELRPMPWWRSRENEDTGTEAAATLLLADVGRRQGRQTPEDIVAAALEHTDGVAFQAFLMPEGADRFPGQLVARIGSTILPVPHALHAMRYRPKSIELTSPAAVAPVVSQLKGTEFDEVIVISSNPTVVSQARTRGLNAGVRILQELPPEALRETINESRAAFVVLSGRLYERGLQRRCGKRPILVGPVRRAQQVQNGAEDDLVHGILIAGHRALISDGPQRAREALEQLAQDQRNDQYRLLRSSS